MLKSYLKPCTPQPPEAVKRAAVARPLERLVMELIAVVAVPLSAAGVFEHDSD